MARPRHRDITFAAAVHDDAAPGPYLRWMRAQDMSENTLLEYGTTFRHFLRVCGDRPLRQYAGEDIEQFMSQMRSELIRPGTDAERPRSPKTLLNYHIALSSLWSWAVTKNFADTHIVKQVPAPQAPPTPIEPLTKPEIVALLRACKETRAWHNRPLTTSRRATAERDRAMICLILDTTTRISEVTDLRIRDIELGKSEGKIRVARGKNKRSKWIPFGRRTTDAMHDYLDLRLEAGPDDWLFINWHRNAGQQMTRDVAGRLIARIGKRAGIQRRVSPHLLRTTAACLLAADKSINAFQLKEIMGHSDIKTTMRYVEAANLNLVDAMRRASPVDNLRL